MGANAAPIRQADRTEQTRQRLLEAGIELFSTNGYDATGTRSVEARAGVQRNLINYHFGSKEVFWKACIDELFRLSADTLGPALRQSRDIGIAERVRFLIRQFVRASAAHPEVMRVMFDEGRRDDWRLAWIVERYGQSFHAVVGDVFEEGRALGLLPDLTHTQFYYLVVSSGAIFALAPECRLLTGEDPRTAEMIDAQADAIARLLAPNLGRGNE